MRGLNNPAKRRAIQIFAAELKCSVVCLQETKISDTARSIVVDTLGPRFADNFISLPAVGSRGGILIACSEDYEIAIEPLVAGEFSISGTIKRRADGVCWSITGVYGPQLEADKVCFIGEMKRIKHHMLPRWMMMGHFNMISRASDKATTTSIGG